ncbi:MAG: hypothetical protein MOIL_01682 [Candidatus Methanolliviera sp. GoM_oil]|nr:MAG: hypothetical protein MOIL_01682 [Candidatus Methanolliviera sp. GoM_oil]
MFWLMIIREYYKNALKMNATKTSLMNVGQGLSEFKPEDFSKRRMIQEAPML